LLRENYIICLIDSEKFRVKLHNRSVDTIFREYLNNERIEKYSINYNHANYILNSSICDNHFILKKKKNMMK